MEKEHGVRQDRREGFTDDWAAVAAELQNQTSSRAPRRTTPRSPTPGNLRSGAVAGHHYMQNDSQETDASIEFCETSAARILRFLDSNTPSPASSRQITVGLTMDSAMSPTSSQRLSLSLGELEPAEVSTARRQGTGVEDGGESGHICTGN